MNYADKIEALTKDLKFRTSRSSGSGGQHVNKVSTKVDLLFDLWGTEQLSDKQKQKIQSVLKNRINHAGTLLISVDATRSQALNRNRAIKKFKQLIEKALQPAKKRKGSTKPKANPEKRLEAKKKRANVKALRKKVVI